MCGIAGFFCVDRLDLANITRSMCDSIAHRGPDSDGVWVDDERGVALGHRRLAILDLSPEGHQPMVSASGRFVMVFNGEVFNYLAFAKELETLGHRFRGHSDTEAMLAAFEEWGIESSVSRFIGMFSFVVWDREHQRVHLVRDRLGIKPLYYGWSGSSFLFASELKPFLRHPAFKKVIRRQSIGLQLQYGYIPAPYSIYEGVFKLLPGSILTLERDQLTSPPDSFSPNPQRGEPAGCLKRYWSIYELGEQALQQQFTGTDAEAIDSLEELLKDSVRLRMISDVPIGAFLSGGIDSSTVVALMQSMHSQPVKTFSIGFAQSDYNEAQHAKSVAAHLQTDHAELYVTDSDLRDVIPLLPWLYDEPFADSSQIPTYLVSKLARTQVTVALSGDGGDELFAGYNRYLWPERVWRRISVLPVSVRIRAAELIRLVRPEYWDRVLYFAQAILPNVNRPGERLHKLAEILAARDLDHLYQMLVSPWYGRDDLVHALSAPIDRYAEETPHFSKHSFVARAQFLDQLIYLPDDNLTKVDRATMGVALEARVPLLDHRVVEFAARLPLHLKIRDHTSKWLLRQVLYRYVPSTLVERPKMGFSVPVGAWLRGPLRDWAEDLLDEGQLRSQGLLNVEPIRACWAEHLRGTSNWQHRLWNVLMFQAWLRNQADERTRQ